ncbi:hypothetical protein F7D09_1233 [Bifidobacterium leontopitheci]|uniref:Uncharacterized protein n=1 Tax=Bifidobacterium leontopitheci TaxID=2650774 RepID=A0A6I1GF33_9BIFI|nr:hypothetical protein F7D09_1233 [Bifidobacterium leontopitheci]
MSTVCCDVGKRVTLPQSAPPTAPSTEGAKGVSRLTP